MAAIIKTAGAKDIFRPDTLCLDFANTMDWHASDQPQEMLHSFEDLLDWAGKKGALDEAISRRLREISARQPKEAAEALAHGIELREAIYRIFSSHANNCRPAANDLYILNDCLREALAHLMIVWHEDHYDWEWPEEEESLERVFWPAARSAADLLTSEWLERIGQCADDRGCGWLFLDESRNRNRRWCDMRGCGNRAKARRFYQKSQKSKPELSPS